MSAGEALESIARAAQQAAELASSTGNHDQSRWLVASTQPCTPSIRPPTPYYLELRQLVPVRIEVKASDQVGDVTEGAEAGGVPMAYKILQFPICSLSFAKLQDFIAWRGVLGEMLPILSADHPMALPQVPPPLPQAGSVFSLDGPLLPWRTALRIAADAAARSRPFAFSPRMPAIPPSCYAADACLS